MDEFDLIDRLIAPLAAAEPGTYGLANDAAVLAPSPGREIVLTKDLMTEGVHFLPDDPPGLVARKLLRTNLSDLAAMGARARGYLLGLCLDRGRDETWLAAFFDGLRRDQEEFGVVLMGGDTIAVPSGVLTLSLTAVGEVVVGGALTRSGAGEGDLVCVSGTIGDGALGLLVRRGGLQSLAPEDRAFLEDRYRLPRPRLALGQSLVGRATAALDVSDGLLADAGHIARRSGLRLELRWPDVPLSEAARRAVEADPGLVASVVGGGDDYELLFTVPPERWASVREAADACGCAVAAIGRCGAGEGVILRDGTGADITPAGAGWRHASEG